MPRYVNTNRYPWPKDCFLQGGGDGVVFSSKGDYRCAFVEAFPQGPYHCFLRGEGMTLDEAEDDCWRKFEAWRDCPHPSFERRGYKNGCGFCTECGTFFSQDITGFEESWTEEDLAKQKDSLVYRLFVEMDDTAIGEVLARDAVAPHVKD